MNNALNHVGFGYNPQGCLKHSSTLEFKALKSKRIELKCSCLHLRNEEQYTHWRRHEISKAAVENLGSTEKYKKKKTREIEFTEEMESNGGKGLIYFFYEPSRI